MIARLLHIANSAPPPGTERRRRFYAMKQRILRWFGTEDGYDLQHIAGKSCWSCGGTGEFYHPHDCYKCDGTGWFKHPVWVLLKRWRFGKYVFHEPVKRFYSKAEAWVQVAKSECSIDVIDGYVEHASYSWKDIHRARFILCMLFDWRLLMYETANWRIRRAVSARCYRCHRRLWSVKQSLCSACQQPEAVIEQDHDIPF